MVMALLRLAGALDLRKRWSFLRFGRIWYSDSSGFSVYSSETQLRMGVRRDRVRKLTASDRHVPSVAGASPFHVRIRY